jgi:cytochrome c biogenesis protein CcmG/thiol:disulfide interchange protein DsbE
MNGLTLGMLGRRAATLALAALWLAAGEWLSPAAGHAQLLRQAAPKAGPAPDRAALPFTLTTLDGKTVTLESFRGKPLLMNFFASWCDPCREEMPLINDLATQAGSRGYHVLGIAVEDTRAAVTDFATEGKLVFPIALDLNSTVKRAYRIFGPPATFFIDGQGTVRDVILGPMTAERAREALHRAGVDR